MVNSVVCVTVSGGALFVGKVKFYWSKYVILGCFSYIFTKNWRQNQYFAHQTKDRKQEHVMCEPLHAS